MRIPLGGAIARQASPLVAGRLASAALTFALPLVLARLLDPGGFGSYKQLFLVAQTVLLGGQLGLTQSLYYFLPREGARRGAFLAQALCLLGVVATAAALALWAGAPWLARHLADPELAALRTPLAVLAAGLLFSAPLEAALTSEGRVGASAAVYVASDAVRAALLLVGALHGGLAGLAWAAAAFAELRVGALAGAIVLGAIPLARPSLRDLGRQLGYALPLAGSILLWVAQKQLMQYTVAARFDAATFALFAVASFHLPVVDIIYAPIGEVLMVRLGKAARGNAAARRVEWHDAVEKLATILWPAAACAFLIGPRLVPILFTHKYDASVPLFVLASLELPLWVLPVDALLRAAGETRFLFAWYGARIVLTLTLVLGGMALAGLAGAIVGGALVEAVSRAVMAARGRRSLGVGLAQLVDGPTLARVAASTLGAALPAWAILRLTGGRAALVAAAALYGASYLGLRLVLGRPTEPAPPAPLPAAEPTHG
jgi:O-antigen/teichoic acid export membrane protein